jgi:N-acetylglucosaminyldiphosphoundecaprenol N-acetyl-beta-D-mannosaminyltransferase
MEKVEILGVKVTADLKKNVLREISLYFDQKKADPQYVVTPYSEFFVEAQANRVFRDALNNAWLALPDGIGVIWAGHYLSTQRGIWNFMSSVVMILTGQIYYHSPFPAKISGSDIVFDLLEMAEEKNLRVMFIGSDEETQQDSKRFVETIYPGVRVCTGYTGKIEEGKVPEEIKMQMKVKRPDMVFVALSYPRQEVFLQKLIHEIPGQYLAFGLGGTLDFISGRQKRAPKWMQKIGLEWLYRLVREPSRIGRMYRAVIQFPLLVLRS